ncbi:uncharacterized protein [Triticum aestivum]|uniref:uncharacterized protein n=1 Tax=Triticum aestivum TaxID=4565 RepID=UPI001D012694|nr:uncharacterized protein LOC123092731 [Triticum aestivum]
MDTLTSSVLEEEQEASRKLRLHVSEIEAVQKQNQTQNEPKLFLGCLVYGETSSLGTDYKIWIGAETSDGINFKISLCAEAPPGFSHLFLKTDDAVAVTPTSTVFRDGVKKRVVITQWLC